MSVKALIDKAILMREYSYCPYSEFSVGAALLTNDGKIYTGCNIENAAFSPTNCAERTAFFKAISDGENNFKSIVVVGGKKHSEELDYCAPCGVCRQVMMEFCVPEEFEVILAKSNTEYKTFKLKELMPMGFGINGLREE